MESVPSSRGFSGRPLRSILNEEVSHPSRPRPISTEASVRLRCQTMVVLESIELGQPQETWIQYFINVFKSLNDCGPFTTKINKRRANSSIRRGETHTIELQRTHNSKCLVLIDQVTGDSNNFQLVHRKIEIQNSANPCLMRFSTCWESIDTFSHWVNQYYIVQVLVTKYWPSIDDQPWPILAKEVKILPLYLISLLLI
uniref:Uncharacterized protein n=1 Tax=Ditylenchus dipsaci TaxID=166011 RepID=A0A915DHZ8_9BILA